MSVPRAARGQSRPDRPAPLSLAAAADPGGAPKLKP